MASSQLYFPPPNPGIYDNFYFQDTYSYQNYGRFWVDLKDMKALTHPSLSRELRTKVMAQLIQIPLYLPDVLENKYLTYGLKKLVLPGRLPQEKELIDAAMNNMAYMFEELRMEPLLKEIHNIQQALLTIQAHWEKFQTYVRNPATKEQTSDFIQEMRRGRTELHQQLNNLSVKSTRLDQTINMLTLHGHRIGPAFYDNPAAFLLGAPMHVRYPNILIAQSVQKAVEIMENIKQQRSVAEGVQHYYRLLIRSMRALRNMEQGMANCLERRSREEPDNTRSS